MYIQPCSFSMSCGSGKLLWATKCSVGKVLLHLLKVLATINH